jgi:mRNA interferase RelE/StbE
MRKIWKISFSLKADKLLEKLDKNTRQRILDYLDKVVNDPRAFGKPLTGNKNGIWRYRVGDYRILCEIINEELIILVIDLGHRRFIYKD